MSWIFHEPFEAAVFGPRRTFAPPVTRRSFSPARRVHASDLWSDEPWPAQRRACAPSRIVHATSTPFSPARRLLAVLLASGVYDAAQTWQRPARYLIGHPQPGDDVGRSASFTVTFFGKGDDPYGGVGLSTANTIALGVDAGRELAVQNLSVFGGASASRTV
jgi:hypothetical protein